MTETYDMDEIKKTVKNYKEESITVDSSTDSTPQIVPASNDQVVVGITQNIVTDKLAKMVYGTDPSKTITEQITEVAEVGATVKAVENEEVRDKMADAKGEQLVEIVRGKAANARADRVKAETQEQKAKKEQNEAMLGIFNADKHYPEWFRKIVIFMFTPFYLLLLLIIGIPTGVIRFTLDCIDGILVRYEDVDERRKPKVRVTFLVLIILGIIAAILFPLLKYYKII